MKNSKSEIRNWLMAMMRWNSEFRIPNSALIPDQGANDLVPIGLK